MFSRPPSGGVMLSLAKRIRETVTPARKTSAFLTRGVLTPQEFVEAGEQLVFKCPTWTWWACGGGDGGVGPRRNAWGDVNTSKKSKSKSKSRMLPLFVVLVVVLDLQMIGEIKRGALSWFFISAIRCCLLFSGNRATLPRRRTVYPTGANSFSSQGTVSEIAASCQHQESAHFYKDSTVHNSITSSLPGKCIYDILFQFVYCIFVLAVFLSFLGRCR